MSNGQSGPSDHDKLCKELGIAVTSTPAETEAEALRVIDNLRLERVGIWHSLGKWFDDRTLEPPDNMVELAADAREIALRYGEREHTRAETFRRERDQYVTRAKTVKRLKSDNHKLKRERDGLRGRIDQWTENCMCDDPCSACQALVKGKK